MIKPLGVKVTRIASGIPVGGELEYTDRATIARALAGDPKILLLDEATSSVDSEIEAKIDEVIVEVDAIASRTLDDAEGLTRGTVDYAFERATPMLKLT